MSQKSSVPQAAKFVSQALKRDNGKVQEAVAKDPEFAQVQADGMKIAELQSRNIAVGIDL
jgi:hypothetical protein